MHNLVPFFSKQYFNTKVAWEDYDFVYIRKGAVLDTSVVKLVKKIKIRNPEIKILLEIPTFPYIDEFSKTIKWDIIYKEKRAVPQLAQYINRVITYSDDKEIFNIPCINISNAYEFQTPPVIAENQTNTLHIIAVASLQFYHGYDRMIKGLINYYKSLPKRAIKFTLVGDGPVLREYRKIVEDNNAEDYIKLVGRKTGVELENFYKEADIAIDSLGRHRSKIFYNSTLKGKEYLAKGLPIVSGVKTDLDEKGFPYYYRVPANDSLVNLSDIIKFYDKIKMNKSKQVIASEIFNYGKENFSFEAAFKPIINYIKEK
jgi:hypothetical protein